MPDMILIDMDTWISNVDSHECQLYGKALCPKMILLAMAITAEEEKVMAAGFFDTLVMKPVQASMLAVSLCHAFGFGDKKHEEKPQISRFLAGKNLLVVDDNIVNRRVAAGTLKKYGANVVCAESAKAALALLEVPHEFDACFMDVQMPEMDGFEATRQIRLMEKNTIEQRKLEDVLKKPVKPLPILAMTADVIQTNEECLKCGMDGYVSKPFEEQQLYRAVAKFFGSELI